MSQEITIGDSIPTFTSPRFTQTRELGITDLRFLATENEFVLQAFYAREITTLVGNAVQSVEIQGEWRNVPFVENAEIEKP